MSLHRFGAELPLVTLTLWLQSAGVAALITWVRRALAGDIREMGALRSAALVVRLTMAVVVLHGLEILLWAGFYRWRCLPSWDSAIYFSASSYSTLGCSDVSLPSELAHAWPAGPCNSFQRVPQVPVNRSFDPLRSNSFWKPPESVQGPP